MAKLIGMAPPKAASRWVTPNGCCSMAVGTHSHGGPFDAFSGGFGVCLEKHSSKVNEADILWDWPEFGVG